MILPESAVELNLLTGCIFRHRRSVHKSILIPAVAVVHNKRNAEGTFDFDLQVIDDSGLCVGKLHLVYSYIVFQCGLRYFVVRYQQFSSRLDILGRNKVAPLLTGIENKYRMILCHGDNDLSVLCCNSHKLAFVPPGRCVVNPTHLTAAALYKITDTNVLDCFRAVLGNNHSTGYEAVPVDTEVLHCSSSDNVQVRFLRHRLQICYDVVESCRTFLHGCRLIQPFGTYFEYLYRFLSSEIGSLRDDSFLYHCVTSY
jgi:hypothetical protein